MSWYQKDKTNLDLTEARDSEWQWHQLGHMQVCTLLQTDNHTSTSPLCFFTGRMPFLPPNHQHQSTEGTQSNNYQRSEKITYETNWNLLAADMEKVQITPLRRTQHLLLNPTVLVESETACRPQNSASAKSSSFQLAVPVNAC